MFDKKSRSAVIAALFYTVSQALDLPEGWSQPKLFRLGSDSNACAILAPEKTGPAGVILWLHGGMHAQLSTKGWTAWQSPVPFLIPGSKYVCSPSSHANADWMTPKGLAHIEMLLDYLDTTTPARMDSIVVAGVSDGCLGALQYAKMGKRKPLRFVLISTLPTLAFESTELIRHAAFRTTRWDVFQGGRDRLFPERVVFPLLRAWAGANPKVKLHLFPEGEHDLSWYGSHAEKELREVFR